MRLTDQTTGAQLNHHHGVKSGMVIALSIGYDIVSFFALYCIMPLFICFLTWTLILRERDTNLKVREIIQNILRKLI